MTQELNSLTDVPGLLVGHAQDDTALTGCTVIICPQGATGGVDQRGGAPGTRETDALRPMHLVEHVHAIILAGGSAFGLDAAGGVMRYLEEQGVGFDTGVAKVPIVASAILFDLALGNPAIRPDAQMGYQACLAASSPNHRQGNVGAGCGATVGKILGLSQATKSGLGMASLAFGNGLVIGALAAVNAFGEILHPENGEILAGARTPGGAPAFTKTLDIFASFAGQSSPPPAAGQNTIIGVIATNAKLNKEQANKFAQVAHNGIALTTRPAHTMFDGDTIFALATNQIQADANLITAFAPQVMAKAIVNAVLHAMPAGGLPSYSSLFQSG